MDNLLAPLEFDDIWQAQKFCKYNRCAICRGELTPKIIEPYDEFLQAHYNVECKNHGMVIKGGAAGVKTIHDIDRSENEREIIDKSEETIKNARNGIYKEDTENDKRLLKELGF